ncbi:MAG: hypothetical protein HQL47_11435 [Gammaproteobacteria bacterium]|nr:hypothetical protein [Gammaproteobacteria bacterium]
MDKALAGLERLATSAAGQRQDGYRRIAGLVHRQAASEPGWDWRLGVPLHEK